MSTIISTQTCALITSLPIHPSLNGHYSCWNSRIPHLGITSISSGTRWSSLRLTLPKESRTLVHWPFTFRFRSRPQLRSAHLNTITPLLSPTTLLCFWSNSCLTPRQPPSSSARILLYTSDTLHIRGNYVLCVSHRSSETLPAFLLTLLQPIHSPRLPAHSTTSSVAANAITSQPT